MYESADFSLTDYKGFRSIISKNRLGRIPPAESEDVSLPQEDFLSPLIARQHERTLDVETVSHSLIHHQESTSRNTMKMLPTQTSSQIDQIYSRIKETDKRKAILL